MRSYPRNSPEAAARIVALVLISDGHVCRSEVETLQQHRIEHELGLAPGAFAAVMKTLCEDRMMGGHDCATTLCNVDKGALAALLAEVDRPGLQATVLRLCQAAALADDYLADTEARIVAAALRQWLDRGPAGPQAEGTTRLQAA